MNWYLQVMKNYAGFSGRARRKEYWMFVLLYAVFLVALMIVGGIVLGEYSGGLVGLFGLAHLVPSIAVAVRRMHDTGRPGWWILVPLANLYFTFVEGTRGGNQYGPDPKAGG